MMTCIVAMMAFREHHTFNGFKHVVVPVFGLLANLLCMLFYLIGPLTVPGMSPKEPFIALGLCRPSGAIYGAIYFFSSSKKRGVSGVRDLEGLRDRPLLPKGVISWTRPRGILPRGRLHTGSRETYLRRSLVGRSRSSS